MKKYLLLVALTLFLCSTMAQVKIVAGEYFWDSDPGIGSGVSFTLNTPSDSVSEVIEFSTTQLAPGLHNLCTRTITDSGVWSLTQCQLVLITKNYEHPITDLEYFWDSDPGIGAGTALDISGFSGDSFFHEIEVPQGMSLGNHTLNIRAMSLSGNWSLFLTKEIKVCSSYGPEPAFEYTSKGYLFRLNNKSKFSTSYLWNMGDGSTPVNIENPTHIYRKPGVYKIELLATNSCGSAKTAQWISIGGIENINPSHAGINGLITGALSGTGFTNDSVTIQFIKSDDTSIILLPLYSLFIDSSLILFELNTRNAKAGKYDVVYLQKGIEYFRKTSSFEIKPAIEPDLMINLKGPQWVRSGVFYDVIIEIENKGNVDALMVPVFYYCKQLNSHQDIQWFFNDKSIAEEVDTLIAMRKEFIDNGGEPDFPGKFIFDFPQDSLYQASKLLALILPRVKPGKTEIRFVSVIYAADLTLNVRAKIGLPLLPHDVTLLERKNENVNGADCFNKTILCTKDLVSNVLDLADIGGLKKCLIDLFNLVDMAIGDQYGSSITEYLLNSYSGGNSNKFEDGPFLKLIKLSQKPIDYPMAIIGMLKSCSPFILQTIVPGGVLVNRFARMLMNDDLNIVSNTISVKNIITNDIPCFMDVFNSCGGPFRDVLYTSISSRDPNAKYGAGLSGMKYVEPEQNISYTITFENIKDASAAAQSVTIIDTLDAAVFNFESFRFGSYGWDTLHFTPGLVSSEINYGFHDFVSYTNPYQTLVNVKAAFDSLSGIVRWQFSTVDSIGLQSTTNPFAGFLPPNQSTPEGEGYVSFSISLKSGLNDSAIIRNRASIIFDKNEEILTNYWENMIDNTPPVSHVEPLSATINDTIIELKWTGADNLSGISGYDIYANKENSEFIRLFSRTQLESARISLSPGLYRFYSVAYDSAGNIEEQPIDPMNNPDAMTRIATQSSSLTMAENNYPTCFPNPGNAGFTLRYKVQHPEKISIHVFNILGQLVSTPCEELQHEPGTHEIFIEVNNPNSGLYFYIIEYTSEIFSGKWIKAN